MSILWKLLVGLGIALPITAYVLGSLVATADEPEPRPPIVISDSGASTSSGTPARKDDQGNKNQGQKTRNDDNRRGDDDRSGDDDVEAVVPTPDNLDDSDDDAGRDDDGNDHGGDDRGDDDNSGPGGGDDDSSGHGSGGDDD